jgi:hypothetical protein
MSRSAVQCRGHATATNPSRQRGRRVVRRSAARALADRRPPERAFLQTLPQQHQPGTTPDGDFHPVCSFERKMKIVPQNGSCRSCSRTTAARRSRDHVAAFTARSASRRQTRSTPWAARTTTPPISIVIPSRAGVVVVTPSRRCSITTGTNIGASSAGKLSKPARAALRQANRCCGEMSCRRATSDTTAPVANYSATIRPLASSPHRRRRPTPTPTRTPTQPRGSEASTIRSTIYATPHPKCGPHRAARCARDKVGSEDRLRSSEHEHGPLARAIRRRHCPARCDIISGWLKRRRLPSGMAGRLLFSGPS